ncbi:MAG: insulinase family protein [Paludibacteraceae bacterium]|nr:insulinase family protein [Paludibacteraceae bacterium]
MKKTLFLCLLMATTLLSAQQQIPQLPIDSAVRVGHLDNGLTYYIRHNELPKQRCEFHIAQRVGAILEEDNQNGLAHFLEHMCFNGTEHFQGKGIIEYFESQGVNFGGDINAYTSLDQTVYRLSNVPTYREGIVDSALLVLHDWSCAVSLLSEEIDAERGVIREEWRTGRTASRRIWARSQAVMFPGTKYAIRDVIGDTAVINNFSYDALRAYYKRWYGPDNQAIVIVGDIDVDQMEQKIKTLWANVPRRANYGERPYELIPDNQEPHVGILTDPEAQQTTITLICKHEPMPAEAKGSIFGYTKNICDELVYSILSERLQEQVVKPNAPFVNGLMAYTDLVPTCDGFYCRFIAKDGKAKETFALLLNEVEKMRRYGFTDDELERAKSQMLNDYEQMYNERNATESNDFVQEYIGHFLDNEPIPGIAAELEMVKAILPNIQTAQLNMLAAEYVTDNNTIVVVTAPDKVADSLPTEEEIKNALAHRTELTIEAPKATQVDKDLVKKMPKKGTIKSYKTNLELGTIEWILSNGVKVVIRPTQFKQDEILLSAYSWGGKSVLKQTELVNAELTGNVIQFMGLGSFSMNDLQKALVGKTVNVACDIANYTEVIEGNSSIKDLETMLQLVYLGFTAPREDAEAFASLKTIMANQLKHKESNPKAIFSDSVRLMATNHSPRTVLWNEQTLNQLNMKQCLAIYKNRFKNAADFTFFFVGNIDPDDQITQELICTYLGGLKTSKKTETLTDDGVRVPQGQVKNYFSRAMQTTTASNRIQYTSYDIPYTLENALTMELIGMILDRRYMESIREREGGSYGVGTYARVQALPVSKAFLLMQFDTDPAKQARLMEIIHEEVKTIVQNGPLAEDLQKDKEILLKSHKENLEQNDWWLEALETYDKYGINLISDYESVVNGITADKVQNMLKQLVESGNVFEVVMTPEN